jgi:twitching motility protein PilT
MSQTEATFEQQQLSLSDLLKKLIELGGSDLHLTTNTPPQVRVHGELHPIEGFKSLTSADTKQLAYSVLTDAQKHRFEENLELDFSFGVRGLSRFRANLFNQRGAVGAVFRAIPYEIKSFETLGLPPVVTKLCDKPRGLILVTGPTGSGKSTTLAAMIDKINRERHEHIVTIEDPIEFLHNHKSCIINQREVGSDTKGFADALRTALRQDPDVVLVGEMRDLETIESALRIAETGHLTFATLHTNSAASTINRIIDVFPSGQQAQIRAQLSLVLEGIMCQALLPKATGQGRVAALEILVPNAAIRNLIREDKVHQIYSAMQTGQEKYGMQTFNQALATLYHKRHISLDIAIQRSSNADELRELIEHGAGLNTQQAGGQPGRPGAAMPPRPAPNGQHPSPYAQPRPVGARPGPR